MAQVVIPGFRKIETCKEGTGNYNNLSNIPFINNVILKGNLKTEDLKLTDPTLTKEGVPADAKVTGDAIAELKNENTALKGDIANSKKAIAELADKKITKFYANSLGETTLHDSDNGKIQDMILYGKSEQKSYSGKNLFNAKYVYGNQTGATVNVINESEYLVNGTISVEEMRFLGSYSSSDIKIPLKAGKYYTKIFGNVLVNGLEITLIDGKTVKRPSIGNGGSITLSNDGGITSVKLNCTVGKTYSNETIRIMVAEDVTAYEPYVGGIPSPNPDYPQEIESVVNPKLRIVGGTKGALLTEVQYNTLTTTLNSYLNDRKEIYYVPINNKGFSNCVVIILNDTEFKSISLLGVVTSYNTPKWITEIRDLGILLCSSTVDPKETIGYGIEPQTVSLPYTLNAIPVAEGGNVTIDGQQYIADYVDIENKKLHRLVDSSLFDTTISIIDNTDWLLSAEEIVYLTDEEVQAFKELSTYYPTTNVMVTSEQLEGYTTFNYPISMANGWNYVKEQLGDTRDYIYDMELQSAEAYVNSEYAVALAELEV